MDASRNERGSEEGGLSLRIFVLFSGLMVFSWGWEGICDMCRF